LLGNLGSSVIYLVVFSQIYLILGIINILVMKFSKCLKLSLFLNKLLLWDFALMFYFSQFTPIVLACLINFSSLSYSSYIEKVSAYLSFSFFTLFILTLIFMSWLIQSKD
jgi:hypothetical protein